MMIDMRTPVFTPRQLDVVQLAASGNTVDQTAVQLGISSRTVIALLIDSRQRLAERIGQPIMNTAHLVAWAVKLGEIDVSA
jgi:FixJ family two-component response regulator